MVVALGSMAIKGVFKAGGLLSGLGATGTKLKEVQQRSKSTSTEMKRMTGQANMLKGALAAIGVAGFSALLLTTPQLAGSLATIKHEMQQIAWSIGKHLKPSLDAVATILRGIRTGEWDTVKKGVEDLTAALIELAAAGVKKVVEVVVGEEPVAEAEGDLLRWWEKVKKAFYDGDGGKLIITLTMEPAKWAYDRVNEYLHSLAGDLKTSEGRQALLDSLTFLPSIKRPSLLIKPAITDFLAKTYQDYGKNKRISEDYGGHEYQTGGFVPRTGMYKLHQGETVTMQGSTPSGGGSTNEITLDFSGANFVLNGGIEMEQFAEVMSNKIAESQSRLVY